MVTFSENKIGLMLESAALSHCGQKRKNNEDAVFHQSNYRYGLYMVCDGLGGLQAGDKASRFIVDTMAAELDHLLFDNKGMVDWTPANINKLICQTVIKADARLRDYVRDHAEIHQMGTTLTLVLIKDNTATIANVGDSRAYIYREGHVTQITKDHSWAAALARMGKIKDDEVAGHPRSNVLYRSLGANSEPDLTVDIFNRELLPGDKLLVCSDGLWHAFPNTIELAEWLDSSGSPANEAQHLVNEANRRDGSDNISAVVVRVNE